MSLKLQPNITQGIRELKMCEDYWAYDRNTDYIDHVESVCRKHSISIQELFEEVGKCFAYLDDVQCVYCGYICPLQIPADIPYMRSKVDWCCELCEYVTRQELNYK